MSIRLQHLREAWTFLSTFTGRAGELVVDTTNNRLIVQDGTTAGGWPAAKLSEVVTNTRAGVADTNYNVLSSDRTIAFTSLSAARTVTLLAANTFPSGTRLIILDESGSCSAANTIIISRTGSDTIDGAASAILASAYGYVALQSDGAHKWTITGQAASFLTAAGIGTAADPSNPLSVYASNALFNSGSDIRVTLNKAAMGNTASFLYQDGFSGRAEIGLCGDDNFHFKVSPDGSTWHDVLALYGSGQIGFQSAQADQSKSVQTPVTGFSITIGNTSTTLLLTPGGTLASGTITMPSAPIDGQIVRVLSSQTIAALSVLPNSGQSINGAPTTIGATAPFAMIFNLGTATWYRMH